MELKQLDNEEVCVEDLEVGDLFRSKYSESFYMKVESPIKTYSYTSCLCISAPNNDRIVGKCYRYLNKTSIIPLVQNNTLELDRK